MKSFVFLFVRGREKKSPSFFFFLFSFPFKFKNVLRPYFSSGHYEFDFNRKKKRTIFFFFITIFWRSSSFKNSYCLRGENGMGVECWEIFQFIFILTNKKKTKKKIQKVFLEELIFLFFSHIRIFCIVLGRERSNVCQY